MGIKWSHDPRQVGTGDPVFADRWEQVILYSLTGGNIIIQSCTYININREDTSNLRKEPSLLAYINTLYGALQTGKTITCETIQ